MSHLVLQVMEGVAQSGRGGNPSLENIPKPPVLSLPPSVEVSANDTVLWNAFLPSPAKHTQSSGYRDIAVLHIPPRI